ncbi:MAG: choice-of-anchor Q domain-containing protein [Chloroflexota bacterium]
MTKRLLFLFMIAALPVLLVMGFLAAGQAQAGSPDVCAGGPGAGCAYSTIQAALNDENTEGTTLILAQETFTENLEITRTISLVGLGPGTVIDGDLADSVVLISGDIEVSMSNLTIQNGDTPIFDGGGLLNDGGIVTLTNVIVQNNTAVNGGGLANTGIMILDNVTVRNNLADILIDNISTCDYQSGEPECLGGGLYNIGVVTITNSVINGNTAKFGGGIQNDFGEVKASNIQVFGNTAEILNGAVDIVEAGGGIENQGTMVLTNSVVHRNNGPYGAGLSNGGVLTVTGTAFYLNVASIIGGGLHNTFRLTLQTSSVYSNEALAGGGIASEGGDMAVVQTAVYQNSATGGGGGGILHSVDPVAGASRLAITNSTISGNSTNGAGGGLRSEGSSQASTQLNYVTMADNTAIVAAGKAIFISEGTVSVQNSIISSQGTACSGSVSSGGYNIGSDSSCGLTGTADLPNTNPLLGTLLNNGGGTPTQALSVGSPAIDRAGGSCPATDQRGVARPVRAVCDRGAYEYDGALERVYLPLVERP